MLLLAMLWTKAAIPNSFWSFRVLLFTFWLKDGPWKRLQGKTYELHTEKCRCPADTPQVWCRCFKSCLRSTNVCCISSN